MLISGQRWVDKFKMAECDSSTPYGRSLRRGDRLRGMVATGVEVQLKFSFPSVQTLEQHIFMKYCGTI